MDLIAWFLLLTSALCGCGDQALPAETEQPIFSEEASAFFTETGLIAEQIYQGQEGTIHYSYFLPDGYDGRKTYPLVVTMPGYDMMWFGEDSSGSNLSWNGFQAWTELDEDMIVVYAQLTDWHEPSARQAVELTEYFIQNFAVDESRVYAAGYSAGGETMSQAVSLRPDLYAAYLHGSSQWDGEYEPLAYAQAVSWCQENNILNGVGGNRFDPNGTLTRAMLATALYRAAGEPAVSGAPAFSDALPGAWYSNAVAWADENGFARGYGNGLFGPNDPASVEQMAVILDRYLGKGDTWVGDPARAHAATRAQIAVALYDALAEGNGDTTGEGGEVLVVYFSATGSTEAVANTIAEVTNGDLFAIEPVEPYTEDDLNWTDDNSRVSREHNDPALQRVALTAATVDSWDNYETVFIGYPIWWGNAAWPINGFISANDFTGKTVIPFCTSASSGLGQSGELLAGLSGTGDWLEGQRFSSGASQATVEQWVDTLDLPALP